MKSGIVKMGIFNWFTKKEKAINIPTTAHKWIRVSFVVYYDKKIKKESIEKVANDMVMIIQNTKAVFNNKNEFLGCINPYLNINALMTYDSTKEMTLKEISHNFIPLISKVKERHGQDEWKIIITSLKENGEPNLYSLPNLYYDMFILAQANKWIIERHDIEINLNKEQTSSFDIKMFDGHPLIDFKEPLLKFEYLVSKRIEEYEKMPELDRIVFGEDFYKMIDRIREVSKKINLNKEQKEWWIKVEKMLK